MELNKIYHGDCLSLFSKLENDSIDCVITSPPYWQLRDYKWDGQWGLEPTFQLYLEHLWQMIDEVYRVLKPTGTAWINLGDTYGTVSGRIGSNKTYGSKHDKYCADAISDFKQPESIHKCLLLIPHRFGIGCIDRGWLVRNDIIWAKRNAMPEPVADRFSKKHEYFFLMVKNEKYYFDLDGVRDKSKPLNRWGGQKLKANGQSKWDDGTGQNSYRDRDMQPNDGMKNPGDVADFWNIPTQPSSDEHYASYNNALIGKPIVAGCPKGGVILDPFCGTATTGCRALELGRNFIGFEGSEKFVKMGEKNLMPYLKQKSLF